MEITLNQLLNIAQLIAMVVGGLWAVFKLGGYFRELVASIHEVLAKHEERLDEHGRRITVLEGGRDNAA